MAAFKVGQRVRVVRSAHGYVGKEGTVIGRYRQFKNPITGKEQYGWPIDIDGIGTLSPHGFPMHALDGWIVPLLPPDDAADQFLARIKKLGSEPVNDAPKVTARERK